MENKIIVIESEIRNSATQTILDKKKNRFAREETMKIHNNYPRDYIYIYDGQKTNGLLVNKVY